MPLYNTPNLTEGIDEALIDVAIAVPSFIPMFLLFIYGVILTLQPSNFGRVYAAYGGIFIISAIVGGFIIDKKIPDRHEIIGALVAFVGAFIIFYAPR